MRILTTFLFIFVLGVSNSKAQAPGLVIQSGLSMLYSKDTNITLPNQAHYGYMIGADARLLDGDLYFIIGGQYHSTSLASTGSPSFFSGHDWKIMMTRMGVGFNVLRLTEKLSIRSKALISINFTLDSPSGGLNIPNYEKVNDSFLGIGTGLGITLGAIDLDLDYQYGFINAYNKQSKSTFDAWTLMAGFHF